MDDDYRDRFYDEVELCVEERTCSDCDDFVRCPYEGHKGIGWCKRWNEWALACDETCEEG